MAIKNYYIILGLNTAASTDEIKAAYRMLAKKYHPDKNLGNKSAEEFFKEIQQAYAVLSNPEKRKKYDLTFFHNETQTKQKQTTAYSGNAYQYAQQKAQEKYQYNNLKNQPKKKDKTESHQILVSISIALMLLYFIISYSTGTSNQTTIAQRSLKTSKTAVNNNKEKVPEINDFDSPYSYFFGEEVSNSESKNCITIHNSEQSEAVVCLVEDQHPNTTIRNQYINAGSTFKMNNIPDGNYFLKVFYGNNWDTTKTYLNKKIKGGFTSEIAFVKLNTENTVFKMKQEHAGATISFSSYEIELNPYQKDQVLPITAEEFFK